jgi:SAM-dependent methyltransferase
MVAERLKNWTYFSNGLAVLLLVCAKHWLRGYSSPTGFPASDWERSIRNSELIVEDYVRHAHIECQRIEFEGRRVLELGPGWTLGTGVLLAGIGIKSYHAIDAFAVAKSTPSEFYQALAQKTTLEGIDRERVSAAARSMRMGSSDLISYSCNSDFNIQKLVGNKSFDLIVSNAAFEHFDDVEATLQGVSACAAPGAIFIAMVDFQTHTRVLRQKDPNNIYRYPPSFYRALHFPGQPNRWRPRDYIQALNRNGWINATARAVDTAPTKYCEWSNRWLAREFRAAGSEMHVLTGVIVAEKPSASVDRPLRKSHRLV